MAHRFTLRRRVEFSDTDAAGIMHFSNFFRFMEAAEHAFYRSVGLSVHPFQAGDEVAEMKSQVGWPRVHASADYRLPLRFEEEVEIELLVAEMRSKSLGLHFNFWKNPDDAEARINAAVGRLTIVCVEFDETAGKMKAVAIPDEWRDRISVAPEEVLSQLSE